MPTPWTKGFHIAEIEVNNWRYESRSLQKKLKSLWTSVISTLPQMKNGDEELLLNID